MNTKLNLRSHGPRITPQAAHQTPCNTVLHACLRFPSVPLALLGLFVLVGMFAALMATHLGIWAPALTLAIAPLVLTEEQVKEFQGILGEMKAGWADLKNLPTTFRSLQDETTQ